MEKINSAFNIDFIEIGQHGGGIGLGSCPGKHMSPPYGKPCSRNLQDDVLSIKMWGASIVVTLMEWHELIFVKAHDLPDEISKNNIKWLHLPIVDMGIPDEAFETNWDDNKQAIYDEIDSGGKVFVHCRSGRGRTGVLAAKILIERNFEPSDAINYVRSIRPSAIETLLQEQYLKKIRPILQNHSVNRE